MQEACWVNRPKQSSQLVMDAVNQGREVCGVGAIVGGSVGCWCCSVKGVLDSRDCHEILIHISSQWNFKKFLLFLLWFPLHSVLL